MHLVKVLGEVTVWQQPDAGQRICACCAGSSPSGPARSAAQQQVGICLGPARPWFQLPGVLMRNLHAHPCLYMPEDTRPVALKSGSHYPGVPTKQTSYSTDHQQTHIFASWARCWGISRDQPHLAGVLGNAGVTAAWTL